MKNLFTITSLLFAGTLAANAATMLKYVDVGNLYLGTWYDDNEISLGSSDLGQDSGFYIFETSKFDFNNLASAKFNIYLNSAKSDFDLKIWAVERENTDLDKTIAEEIIASAKTREFVLTSITTTQVSSLLSIDITSVLKKIAQGKDVAILIGLERGNLCSLDYGPDSYTRLSVEFSVVPEPSMFGLLAGTLALALAGTRRRRRK